MLLVKVPFLLLLCLSAAAGQQETTVKPGEDATLQCHCPSDAAVTLLEWVRLEPKSDGYVFFYRNNRLYENYQHPSFRGRVELRDPEMKGGDMSVTLRNVTANDAGTYKCEIISSKTENGERKNTDSSNLVSLIVTDSSHPAALKMAEGIKDEGDNGGGNEDGRMSQILGHSAPIVLAVGIKYEGNKDGRMSQTVVGLLVGGTAVMSLVVVIVISSTLKNKHTCVSYQRAAVEA